ncbi:hypothetical protein N9R79_03305 [Vibrio sp.]|nr:hypothetical protein [Vibrio sp.]
MHQFVNTHIMHNHYMQLTPRKNAIKHRLLYVQSGVILAKLGKKEFAVEADQMLWLPFDCLYGLTILPNTQFIDFQVSSRVQHALAHQAGYITPSPLLLELFKATSDENTTSEKQDLINRLILLECSQSEPVLYDTSTSNIINQQLANLETTLTSSELRAALVMRQAHKEMQSGIKEDTVVQRYYQGDHHSFQHMKNALLGDEHL